MYWNKEAETMPREELRKLQLQRLREVVKYAYERVPFYRKRFEAAGIKPEDIKSLEDLKYIPFTSKADLREVYPFGIFAVPLSEIVEIHSSSGTTGKPVVAGYTRRDLEVWEEVMARSLTMIGVTSQDVVQIAYGYGLFTGGLGFHYGALKIGATIVPASAGNTRRQITLMQALWLNERYFDPNPNRFLDPLLKTPPQFFNSSNLIGECFLSHLNLNLYFVKMVWSC